MYTQGIPGYVAPYVHPEVYPGGVYTSFYTLRYTLVVYMPPFSLCRWYQPPCASLNYPVHCWSCTGYTPPYTPWEKPLRKEDLLASQPPVSLLGKKDSPNHPFHCWAKKGGREPVLASHGKEKEGRMARSSLPGWRERGENGPF